LSVTRLLKKYEQNGRSDFSSCLGARGSSMHMADALISPAVGGILWAAAAGVIAHSSKKVREEADDRKVPMMGVLGAFVFAAQMINFTIPGTGSSGHLAGGMILAILLGPSAAFLVMASVLTVQALFFADGGLLALGCNIFNIGFFSCFVAYPLIYRPMAGSYPARTRLMSAAVLSSVVSLQLGALGVVLQTFFSGISSLPIRTFLLLMLPIHLAIGIVEGVVTAAVVFFVRAARPEMFEPGVEVSRWSLKRLAISFLVLAALTAGLLGWFASSHPDGLEWSIARVTGSEELQSSADGVRVSLAEAQRKTAIFPDYGFREQDGSEEPPEDVRPPLANSQTSVAGLVGGAMTLALAGLIGWFLRQA
jgi:cobalt/nickel transport system permease protein